MDLGISGRKAIVCASSKGLGKACALSLAREGCLVVINGRDHNRIERAAEEIRAMSEVEVLAVPADITTEAGRRQLANACPDADILVTNSPGTEPGTVQRWDSEEWTRAFQANFAAPASMIHALLPGMRARKFGRIVNITSTHIKAPKASTGISTAARIALVALSKSIALEAAVDNVTINNLLPERIDTDRQRLWAEHIAQTEQISYAEARSKLIQTIVAKRLGTLAEFGDACAYLCSAQAGYISGENLRLDGGSYRGLV